MRRGGHLRCAKRRLCRGLGRIPVVLAWLPAHRGSRAAGFDESNGNVHADGVGARQPEPFWQVRCGPIPRTEESGPVPQVGGGNFDSDVAVAASSCRSEKSEGTVAPPAAAVPSAGPNAGGFQKKNCWWGGQNGGLGRKAVSSMRKRSPHEQPRGARRHTR